MLTVGEVCVGQEATRDSSRECQEGNGEIGGYQEEGTGEDQRGRSHDTLLLVTGHVLPNH